MRTSKWQSSKVKSESGKREQASPRKPAYPSSEYTDLFGSDEIGINIEPATLFRGTRCPDKMKVVKAHNASFE